MTHFRNPTPLQTLGQQDLALASSIDHRAFLESTPFVPWEIDLAKGRLVYVGPQAVDLLGYPLVEWIERTFWEDHVLPDDQAAFLRAREALAAGGEPYTIDFRMEHADGHVIWVSETASAVLVEGRVACLRGLLSDVTERKRLEESLAHDEERLRGLLQGAPDPMILVSEDGVILHVNDQAEYLSGYAFAEIVGSSIRHLVPERLQDRLHDLRAAFERDPRRRSLVDGHGFAIKRVDGNEVPVELSVSPVPGPGGRQFLYALRDLTVRRRVEAQLRSSESRLRSMAEALPAMVSYVDVEQRYRFVNDRYASWVGFEQEPIEGRLVREVVGETLYKRLRPAIEKALGGQRVHFQFEVASEDRDPFPVDVTYVPHREGGEVVGYFVVVMDLSAHIDAALAGRLPSVESHTPARD